MFVGMGANGAGGYDLTDSVRFRSSASAYLERTQVSGTTTTWTYSCWIKRGSLGVQKPIFTVGEASTNDILLYFQQPTPEDRIHFLVRDTSTIRAELVTTAKYRDPSAWYHIVAVYDSTNATSGDRIRLYVNGERITSFDSATYPSLNQISIANNASYIQRIGRLRTAASYFDGYMTEVNFVDGQALTPLDFGEYNATTGVWQPKEYTGTYGTNGFYLNFSDSSAATATALGKDYSGNSNNWTPNNIVVSGVNIAYSNYFNGTSHVATPTSNNLAIGSGDFTIELWFKKTGGPTQQALFAYLDNDPYLEFDNNKIRTIFGGSDINGTTTIVNNVWYHVAWTRVSGQVRLYLNGTLEASINNGTNMTDNYAKIGRRITNTDGFTGYITNVRMVKGTAVYTSNFTPPTAPLTAISGTQLLTLQSSSLVDNSSNNFSLTNSGTTINSSEHPFALSSSIDIMSDVPTLTDEDTANYAAMNPLLDTTGNITFSEGNLKTVDTNASTSGSAIAVSSGKWFAEMVCTAKTASNAMVGICTVDGFDSDRQLDESLIGGSGYGYVMNGAKLPGGAAYGATWAIGDVIGIALDLDSTQNTVTFYKNGSSQGAININNAEYVFCNSNGQGSSTVTYVSNFGQRPFAYTPPTGYLKLNTFNLPDSSIVDGSEYMNTKLWTGNGTSQTISGLEFAPDLVWGKSRSATGNHVLVDSIRGDNTNLSTNLATAESSGSSISNLVNGSFDVAGGGVNASSVTMVGWSWRGSDSSPVSNTDGTIASTVSANPTAGFSVVTYTGNGSGASTTVGHGLGVAPAFYIIKNRSSTTDWAVYHRSLPSFDGGNYPTNSLRLNTTGALASTLGLWGAPTSTTINIGDGQLSAGNRPLVNTSSATYVAYCFAEVEGYSKFGSYTGNGSANGPFVYTGFRPAFVMWKRTDAGGNSWRIKDSTRNPYNETLLNLFPNDSSAENSDTSVDFVSNGFKNRSTGVNVSSATYIYMAFAENPFKNSLAR